MEKENCPLGSTKPICNLFFRRVLPPNRQELQLAATFHLLFFTSGIAVPNSFLTKMMFARVVRSSARHLSSTTKVGPSAFAPLASTALRHYSLGDSLLSSSNDANEPLQLKTSFHLPDPTIACSSGRTYHQLTKIVATIGPTSEQEEPLRRVVHAGMKIMRLNFSHATKEEVELRMKNLALAQVGCKFTHSMIRPIDSNGFGCPCWCHEYLSTSISLQ